MMAIISRNLMDRMSALFGSERFELVATEVLAYQCGSLQLLASLNSGSTRSFPQSFLPARRGCF